MFLVCTSSRFEFELLLEFHPSEIDEKESWTRVESLLRVRRVDGSLKSSRIRLRGELAISVCEEETRLLVLLTFAVV